MNGLSEQSSTDFCGLNTATWPVLSYQKFNQPAPKFWNFAPRLLTSKVGSAVLLVLWGWLLSSLWSLFTPLGALELGRPGTRANPQLYFLKKFYFFIFVCAGSLLLFRLFSSCGKQGLFFNAVGGFSLWPLLLLGSTESWASVVVTWAQ